MAAAWVFPHEHGTGHPAARAGAVAVAGPGSPPPSWQVRIAVSATSGPDEGDADAQASPTRPRVDCKVARCVALTFDDGPGPETKRLLRTLAEHDARATFFLVGEMVERRPWVARRITDAGHEVGVHSWNHPDLRKLSPRQVRAQLTRTRRVITEVTGVRPVLSRPPYGASSPQARREAKRAGLSEILWTVDPTDWKHRNARVVRRSVERDLRRNSIVLLHDIRPTTVDSIGPLLRHLERRGITLVTVSELLGPTEPGRTYGDPGWPESMRRALR